VVLEGRRPILAEVQALVTGSASDRPRRATSGVDGNRLAMILAVLHQRCRIRLHAHDVFMSTVGGARISEHSGDLAAAIAVASAWKDKPVPTDVVAIGELGLAGELRRVRDLPLRLAEAARLGFDSAIVPLGPDDGNRSVRKVGDMRVVGVPDIESALRVLDLAKGDHTPIFTPRPERPQRPVLGLV